MTIARISEWEVRDENIHTVTALGVISAQEQKVETTAEAWLRRSANPVADCAVAVVALVIADGVVAAGLAFVALISVVAVVSVGTEELVVLLLRALGTLGAGVVVVEVTVVVVVDVTVTALGVTVMVVPVDVTVDVGVLTGYLL